MSAIELTEAQARQNLKALIEKYNALTDSDRKIMSEASVVRQFIDILLRDVLGWPIEDPARYQYEQVTQVGRPDMVLTPEAGGTIFVEAKRFGIIKELKEATKTASGTITPGQMALPGMAVDRTAEEQQAINYAFANNGTWAILSNFQKLRLFNARRDWLVLSFERPAAYLSEFDMLWELSYRRVQTGSLDRLSNQRVTAEIDNDYLKFINEWREYLAQDVVKHRAVNPWAFLSDGTINLSVLRSVVQRTIDRLVIIRFAEDHLVVPPGTLRSFYDVRRQNIYSDLGQMIGTFFRRFDQEHNSALFARNTADQAVFSDEVLLGLISKLYEARYRSMPADIMGNTYEQYLGKTLIRANGGIKTADNLETRKKQGSYYTPQVIVRYVVDNSLGRYLYGTENGQPDGSPIPGELRQTSATIRDLRVLDGACGSGSFLIYAYEVLDNFYENEKRRLEAERQQRLTQLAASGVTDPFMLQIELIGYKTELDRISNHPRLILETHLYGVDLDPQAAEIAVVNLMMRGMERRQQEKRLPLLLNQNIKVGNALVGRRADDPRLLAHADQIAALIRLRAALISTEHNTPEHDAVIVALQTETSQLNRTLTAEIDAHFATVPDVADTIHPFCWGIEFPEVFFDPTGKPLEKPGFTIIVGNPPYGGALSPQEIIYFNAEYNIGTTDTAGLFLARFVNLGTKGAYEGFIVPKSFTYSSSWSQVRQLLLSSLTSLIDCGKVWQEVKLEQVICLHRNHVLSDSYRSLQKRDEEMVYITEIAKSDCDEFGFYLNGITKQDLTIAHRMRSSKTFLGEFLSNVRGVGLHDTNIEQNNEGKRAIGGKQVQPYALIGTKGYVSNSANLAPNASVVTGSILIQNLVAHILNPVDHIKIIGCVITDSNSDVVILDTVNQFRNFSNLSSYYFLALLLSKAVNWYVYRFIFARAVRTMHFDNPVSERIPVPKLDLANEQIKLKYESIVSFTKQLSQLYDPESSIENKAQIKEQIKTLQQSIDQLIYELYELSDQEKQIIEASMDSPQV